MSRAGRTERPGYGRSNQWALVIASFMGFTGFTLVMPFLPLYIRELGVTDPGKVALWAGLCLGVTPGLSALLAPMWGRIADRFGRKLMVLRALASFVVIMGASAFVTEAWQLFALRAIQGLFAGYGALVLAMAADSAPSGEAAGAIGTVQGAQRLGPAIGPVLGAFVSQMVGLRGAFLVTAVVYAAACILMVVLYHEPRVAAQAKERVESRITFRDVLAFQSFLLLMGIIFGLQLAERSLGPIIPVYLTELTHSSQRVALLAGLFFSTTAVASAVGSPLAGLLLRVWPVGRIISVAAVAAALAMSGILATHNVGLTIGFAGLFGLAAGVTTTVAYTAGSVVIPAGGRGVGFSVLTGSAMVGVAISPALSGLLAAVSIRLVFILDIVILGIVAALALRVAIPDRPRQRTTAPVETV